MNFWNELESRHACDFIIRLLPTVCQLPGQFLYAAFSIYTAARTLEMLRETASLPTRHAEPFIDLFTGCDTIPWGYISDWMTRLIFVAGSLCITYFVFSTPKRVGE